jgi:predicted MPP superfamily phosphohydrolase
MLLGLEAIGVRMLMNEAEPLARDQDRLWIVGVDDPHFFKTNDLRAAMAAVPEGETAVLLSHSADGYRDAERAGVGAFLCGHTHGGQICLPYGIPIVTSGQTPRRLASGPWRHGNMIGYTSRGVGTSVVAARFNCLPEVTLHTLRGR